MNDSERTTTATEHTSAAAERISAAAEHTTAAAERISAAAEHISSPEDFERRISSALERRSDAAIPAGFAAQIATNLPRRHRSQRPAHLGRTIAVIACALTLLAMLVLAPHSAGTYRNLPFDAELALTAQLAAIAAWLVMRWQQI